jgi:hypothetical protein
MTRLCARQRAERVVLESLPGVAACNFGLKRNYEARLARIARTVSDFARDIRDPASHDDLIERLRQDVAPER